MINPKSLTFLAGIKKNNNKHWYEENKNEYKTLRAEFSELINELAREVAGFDTAVAQSLRLGKKVTKVFRIHRDARFVKDGVKYKTNISGYISADIKSDKEPVYYLSIEPGGKSFTGGGLHSPERMVLSDIRDEIERQPKFLKKMEASKTFSSCFPNGLSREFALKTAPRGHDIEHEAIEYLRLKNFTAGKSLSDAELKKKPSVQSVVATFKALYPLNLFLRNA